jgi:hypothetical protein
MRAYRDNLAIYQGQQWLVRSFWESSLVFNHAHALIDKTAPTSWATFVVEALDRDEASQEQASRTEAVLSEQTTSPRSTSTARSTPRSGAFAPTKWTQTSAAWNDRGECPGLYNWWLDVSTFRASQAGTSSGLRRQPFYGADAGGQTANPWVTEPRRRASAMSSNCGRKQVRALVGQDAGRVAPSGEPGWARRICSTC